MSHILNFLQHFAIDPNMANLAIGLLVAVFAALISSGGGGGGGGGDGG